MMFGGKSAIRKARTRNATYQCFLTIALLPMLPLVSRVPVGFPCVVRHPVLKCRPYRPSGILVAQVPGLTPFAEKCLARWAAGEANVRPVDIAFTFPSGKSPGGPKG